MAFEALNVTFNPMAPEAMHDAVFCAEISGIEPMTAAGIVLKHGRS